MLPGISDGFEGRRAVRENRTRGIILMLTARDEDLTRFSASNSVRTIIWPNPVQPRLPAAIKALLRRAPVDMANRRPIGRSGRRAELSFGTFTISQATRSTLRQRRISDLTTAEFDLLWLLARHAGNILSRDDLLQELRGIGFDGLDRSIDARISRLRRKLGDDPRNQTASRPFAEGYLFSKHDWQ